jgi:hypothetical protein
LPVPLAPPASVLPCRPAPVSLRLVRAGGSLRRHAARCRRVVPIARALHASVRAVARRALCARARATLRAALRARARRGSRAAPCSGERTPRSPRAPLRGSCRRTGRRRASRLRRPVPAAQPGAPSGRAAPPYVASGASCSPARRPMHRLAAPHAPPGGLNRAPRRRWAMHITARLERCADAASLRCLAPALGLGRVRLA